MAEEFTIKLAAEEGAADLSEDEIKNAIFPALNRWNEIQITPLDWENKRREDWNKQIGYSIEPFNFLPFSKEHIDHNWMNYFFIYPTGSARTGDEGWRWAKGKSEYNRITGADPNFFKSPEAAIEGINRWIQFYIGAVL